MVAGTIFLVLIAGLLGLKADPWKCANGTITADVSNQRTYFFPNVTTTALPFYSPQSCRWALTVPVGTYAYLTAFMNLNQNDTFTISNGPKGNYNHGYDSNHNVSVNNDVPGTGTAQFFIPTGTFTITFTSSGSQNYSSFAFEVYLNNLPSKIDQKVSTDQQQAVLLYPFINKQFSLSSNKTFTLRTIAGGCNADKYIFDACQLYKGPNAAKGIFVSGLSQFLGGAPPALKGDYTVVCFNVYIPETSRILITGMPVLPPGGTWQVSAYCPYVTLSAFGVGEAYATDFCGDGCDKYVTNVQFFNSNATLDMYTGSIGSSFAWLGSMTNSDVKNKLPQLISGDQLYSSYKTFRVTKGTAAITLQDTDSGSWSKATSARQGFISSPNYGITSSFQSFHTKISSDTKYTYIYSVNSLQLGTLQVSGVLESGTNFTSKYLQNTFNSSREYSFVGYGIDFQFTSQIGTPGKGVMAHYRVAPYNSAFAGSMMMVVATLAALVN